MGILKWPPCGIIHFRHFPRLNHTCIFCLLSLDKSKNQANKTFLHLPSILRDYSSNLPSGPVCVDPPPEGPAVITCISTNNGPPGTEVTIEGRGFGWGPPSWDNVIFSNLGGLSQRVQNISYEDTKIVVLVPGQPWGECSWDRHCHASLSVHIPVMYAPDYDPLYFTNHVPFTITGLLPEPPEPPGFLTTDLNASVGDIVEIYAFGLSPIAANNLVKLQWRNSRGLDLYQPTLAEPSQNHRQGPGRSDHRPG